MKAQLLLKKAPSKDAHSSENYRALCAKVKITGHQHLLKREHDLLFNHDQAVFYKYVKSAIEHPQLLIQLVDNGNNTQSGKCF